MHDTEPKYFTEFREEFRGFKKDLTKTLDEHTGELKKIHEKLDNHQEFIAGMAENVTLISKKQDIFEASLGIIKGDMAIVKEDIRITKEDIREINAKLDKKASDAVINTLDLRTSKLERKVFFKFNN